MQKITLYTAGCIGNPKNCIYTNKVVVASLDDFCKAVRYDHVFVKYRDKYRSVSGFVSSNCIAMECDNDHSDNATDWVTPTDVASTFVDVQFYVSYSKSHNKVKGSRSARPRFHIVFPITTITDAKQYENLKTEVLQQFPYFDKNAVDVARFFFGVEDPKVEFFPGNTLVSEFIENSVDIDVIPEGSRNSTLSRFAGRIVKRYGKGTDAYEMFLAEAKRCAPPLEDEELAAIWRSAEGFADKVSSEDGYIPPEIYNSDVLLKPRDFSDVGQAEVLSREYASELRYSPSTDYIRYNGMYWEESKSKAQAVAQELTSRQLEEAQAEITKANKLMNDTGATALITGVGTNAPYGYIKSPEDKHQWIVDESAAQVVREAFRMCVKGYGPTQIANIFTERKIPNPTAHAKMHGRNIPDNRIYTDDYTWHDSTIVHMLSRQEYLGHTVNFKTYRKSYKNKKQMKNDESQWQIFENTHEAIIDQETFDIVQRIRASRRRLTPMGEMPILSGMLYCADCGKKLYQVRCTTMKQKEYLVCSTYRKIKGGCTSHQIQNEAVETLLLDGIRSITTFAREHENEFVELVTKKCRADVERTLRDSKHELEQAQARINKLDEIIQRLYEDNIEGKISDERFAKMTINYEVEQQTLESRVAELKAAMTKDKANADNADKFLKLVRKHTEIKELTAEILREFVEKVYVYQSERVDGKKVQRIKIIYNCIGDFQTPPTEHEKSA